MRTVVPVIAAVLLLSVANAYTISFQSHHINQSYYLDALAKLDRARNLTERGVYHVTVRDYASNLYCGWTGWGTGVLIINDKPHREFLCGLPIYTLAHEACHAYQSIILKDIPLKSYYMDAHEEFADQCAQDWVAETEDVEQT